MVRNDLAANAITQASTIIDMLTMTISVLSAGSLILINQYKGAKDKSSEHKIYSLAFFFNLLLGFLLGMILIILADPILKLMNVSNDFFDDAKLYLQISGGFLFLQCWP